MATAFYSQRPDNGPATLPPVNLYPRGLGLPITELDLKDSRYPSTLSTPPQQASRRSSGMPLESPGRNPWEMKSQTTESSLRTLPETPSATGSQRRVDVEAREQVSGSPPPHQQHSFIAQQQQQQQQYSLYPAAVSYALPSGSAAHRVTERYNLEEGVPRVPSRASGDVRQVELDPPRFSPGGRPVSTQRQQTPGDALSQERHYTVLPRHPPLPGAMGSASAVNSYAPNSPSLSPLPHTGAFNPSLGIPISPKPRAYAQHPTYVTPQSAPNPLNTVYSPAPPPQEEVCVECAMRDQDMADVDVTSPGIWERDSDAAYNDLILREQEDELSGVKLSDTSRPRSKGGRLTEQNIKIWLSINPREPASRQQTLELYLKSQRRLLEAEALAHSRAMQEARQLDNRMRDAYSQLRRSAYDMGSSAAPSDDTGGVRIKPPRSPTSPAMINPHGRSHSREVTLLENGMIVEHVDVRKEEREERERRRKEEKRDRSRTRKTSRGSRIEVTSVYSVPHTDSGVGLKPGSRYSQASCVRPNSVLSGPLDRPNLPRAYSQYSMSDVHSLGSASPNRPRFFGFKNLSTGWRSQDSLAPSGMSGSVVDMHVALQREAHGQPSQNRVSMARFRRSQMWSPSAPEPEPETSVYDEKSVTPKKKKSGFAKIWNKVTGSAKHDRTASGRPNQAFEDDSPLAPPPPLSYLVNRTPGEGALSAPRHASTPSLGMSPGTAPSSPLPSPTPSGEREDDGRVTSGVFNDQDNCESPVEEHAKSASFRNVHPVTSEPDMRLRGSWNPALGNMSLTAGQTLPIPRPGSIVREKSLPPLPGEPHRTAQMDRPNTVYSFAPQSQTPDHLGLSPPHAPFRNAEPRRQSFGGMTTRPNLNQATHPQLGGSLSGPQGQRRSLAPNYDEFAFSRRSLGRLSEDPASLSTLTPSKRKSRFGLSSLFGKKNSERQSVMEPAGHDFPSLRRSGSGGEEATTMGGNNTSTSRHSSGGGAALAPRMSVASRKTLQELVEQDPEFVAYRYPSGDQRLDLLR